MRLQTTVATSLERLWSAIIDITHWPAWDAELESTEHERNLAVGTRFSLKPPRAALGYR